MLHDLFVLQSRVAVADLFGAISAVKTRIRIHQVYTENWVKPGILRTELRTVFCFCGCCREPLSDIPAGQQVYLWPLVYHMVCIYSGIPKTRNKKSGILIWNR